MAVTAPKHCCIKPFRLYSMRLKEKDPNTVRLSRLEGLLLHQVQILRDTPRDDVAYDSIMKYAKELNQEYKEKILHRRYTAR